ncbi:MAG TPA: D-glycero-beta-D-manno-heptose 1,7-bisphosphate 7-phosphatase [Vicinamibacterales bacterium]|jgi:D-glycero-D-manno-heptose 1,7-bisphosphate phosphatase|nr:D-glycero-beta-D-manno-heptose 1,7-bisphosphate 7-phosphatase [Vicinamibacterales bacterium]
MRPCVFLDRDGTIIEDVGFLRDIGQLDVLPWSADAIKLLNDGGYAVVVVTNQSGVGRGYFDEAHVQATHQALDAKLAAQGARVDAYYYCPHHPDAADARYGTACDCRKPAPGMLRRAAADLQLDLPRSWMVGDWWRDVQAGVGAGVRTILVRSGRSAEHRPAPEEAPRPDAILNNLMEAAAWILRRSSR